MQIYLIMYISYFVLEPHKHIYYINQTTHKHINKKKKNKIKKTKIFNQIPEEK